MAPTADMSLKLKPFVHPFDAVVLVISSPSEASVYYNIAFIIYHYF